MVPPSSPVAPHAPPPLETPQALPLTQSAPLSLPPLPSNQVQIIPLDVARDVFDIEIAPTLTAPTPLAQSVRQQMYRRMYLTIVSSDLVVLTSIVSPESLYNIILNALQQLGLSQ